MKLNKIAKCRMPPPPRSGAQAHLHKAGQGLRRPVGRDRDHPDGGRAERLSEQALRRQGVPCHLPGPQGSPDCSDCSDLGLIMAVCAVVSAMGLDWLHAAAHTLTRCRPHAHTLPCAVRRAPCSSLRAHGDRTLILGLAIDAIPKCGASCYSSSCFFRATTPPRSSSRATGRPATSTCFGGLARAFLTHHA